MLERSRQLLGNRGEQIPEDLLDVPDDVLDLVAHRGAFSAHFVGLPERRDLLADVARGVFLFGGRELATISVLEDLGDAVELLEQRATGRLARVGREGERDLERRDR